MCPPSGRPQRVVSASHAFTEWPDTARPTILGPGRPCGNIVMSRSVKRAFVAAVFGLAITLTAVGSAAAAPENFPTNPNACAGNSSTTADTAYQASDPDKLRR